MKSTFWRDLCRPVMALLVIVATVVVAGHSLSGAPPQANVGGTASPWPAEATFPKDLYPDTGNRFPAIKREGLDEAGKKLYDTRGVADAFGPGAIRLYSIPVADSMSGINDFLRHKSGIEPRLVELAILVTARELDCKYVWTAHEPAAQKAGLSQAAIDAVKYRQPVAKLGEKEAVIIELGRGSIGKHKVA